MTSGNELHQRLRSKTSSYRWARKVSKLNCSLQSWSCTSRQFCLSFWRSPRPLHTGCTPQATCKSHLANWTWGRMALWQGQANLFDRDSWLRLLKSSCHHPSRLPTERDPSDQSQTELLPSRSCIAVDTAWLVARRYEACWACPLRSHTCATFYWPSCLRMAGGSPSVSLQKVESGLHLLLCLRSALCTDYKRGDKSLMGWIPIILLSYHSWQASYFESTAEILQKMRSLPSYQMSGRQAAQK